MNWRRPVITSLLRLSGSKILNNLDYMLWLEHQPYQVIKQEQEKKIQDILYYSFKFVPYYNFLFKRIGLTRKSRLTSENLSKIPPLTKKIMTSQLKFLKSTDPDLRKRKPYLNHSGGSSGSPVTFYQDKQYSDWNIANKIYYKTFAGQNIGDKELRLWGSERDLLHGSESNILKFKNWLYNRHELNAFKMDKNNFRKFLETLNSIKPQWIEAYVQPLYELALFAKRNNLYIHSPKGVLTSAGTLYSGMRSLISEVFDCPVFNRYGTREVGDIACSCPHNKALHLSTWHNYIEILDKNLEPVENDSFGDVYVTTLNNYSMPLIRYKIGDIAKVAPHDKCSCGRNTPLLPIVEGREMSVIKKKDGSIIPAEFFIHFVGVVYNEGAIDKFQVIQEDYDRLVIKVIISDSELFKKEKGNIENSIKKVMGGACDIVWEEVNEIPALKSGKYLYVYSRVV